LTEIVTETENIFKGFSKNQKVVIFSGKALKNLLFEKKFRPPKNLKIPMKH